MISRHSDETAPDRDIDRPWEQESDDDNQAYDREPSNHRPGRTVVYAMMIAMGLMAAVVAGIQLLA